VPGIGALQRPSHDAIWTTANIYNLCDEQLALNQNAVTPANDNFLRGHPHLYPQSSSASHVSSLWGLVVLLWLVFFGIRLES
jgi:hypothetical protein